MKLYVSTVVGVPLITPVELPSESPLGKVPAATDHAYVGTPPVAVSAWLYAVPVIALGTLVVVMTRSATVTIIESAWSSVSAVGVWESVTLTVKFDVPPAVGVPLSVPLDELSDRPAGRLPERTDHV